MSDLHTNRVQWSWASDDMIGLSAVERRPTDRLFYDVPIREFIRLDFIPRHGDAFDMTWSYEGGIVGVANVRNFLCLFPPEAFA